MVRKLEEFAASAAGKVWTQLSSMAAPILLAGLLWFYINGEAQDQRFQDATLISLAATHAQLTAFIARADGELRTQAAVDADQDNRITRNAEDIASMGADVRLLLLWRTNVIDRGSPL